MNLPTVPSGADAYLPTEQGYLAAARRALCEMHAEVVSSDTPLSDAEGTDEIWHNTVYRQARARRAQALVDLPGVALFFGRLDYQPGTIHEPEPGAVGEDLAGAAEADRVYIGRRHVRDRDGTPLVVDWRTPVSAPFYGQPRGPDGRAAAAPAGTHWPNGWPTSSWSRWSIAGPHPTTVTSGGWPAPNPSNSCSMRHGRS